MKPATRTTPRFADMSDTPRTDAAELDLIRTQPGLDEKRVMAAFDFARELERENAQLKADAVRLDKLERENARLKADAGRIDKLESILWGDCFSDMSIAVETPVHKGEPSQLVKIFHGVSVSAKGMGKTLREAIDSLPNP
jgi:hypothetical protein